MTKAAPLIGSTGDSSVGATFAGAGAGQDVAAGIVQIQWK